MSPADLTVEILKDIREEIRGVRQEMGGLRTEQQAFREETATRFGDANGRFEVVETTLRDLAQQLVILGRGVKVLLEHRRGGDDRVEALERRVDAIEQRLGSRP